MPRTITGPIEYPDGTGIVGASVKFVATANDYSGDGSVPIYSEISATTTTGGALSVTLNNGTYRVLLQEADASAWLTLGTIVVETDTSVALGSLIDTSDTSSVLTYADVATQTWVAAYVSGGGSAGDIAVTDLGIGTATAGQYLRINSGGTAIIGEDLPRAENYYHYQY